jgi:hypothetical protein
MQYVDACIRSGVVIAALAVALPGQATVINGGFEAGLGGWTAVGDAATVGAAFGSGPVAGTSQAIVTSALDGDDAVPLNASGNAPLLAGSDLEAAIGLAVGDLDGLTGAFDLAFEGSAIAQSFHALAGQTLRFDWNFLTGDDLAADFAFVAIDGVVTLLADSLSATLLASGTPFAFETGFATFTHTFAVGGQHDLVLGVLDANDAAASSALLVDGVAFVPEPGVPALLAVGVAGLLLARRRTPG